MKVYCIDCKHHWWLPNGGDRCGAPKNNTRSVGEADTYLYPGSSRNMKPEEKNRNNDCEWYEKRK